MSRLGAVLTLLLLAATPASAATKHGITPLTPKAGATITAGSKVTFRMRVKGAGAVFVHVCRSKKASKKDGTICDTEDIGEARRAKDGIFKFAPKRYSFPSFWLNAPGTYYWQALRVSCSTKTDCAAEGPVVRFRVVAAAAR